MDSDFNYTCKIHNDNWTISVIDSWNKHDGKEVIGETFSLHKKIYILKSMPLSCIRSTLIHELTHAVFFEYGFSDILMEEENVCNFNGSFASFIIETTNDFMNKLNIYNEGA